MEGGASAGSASKLDELREQIAGLEKRAAEWDAQVREWLPTAADREFVQSLMGRVAEPGKFANWIAPPAAGINGQPIECEYVRFS